MPKTPPAVADVLNVTPADVWVNTGFDKEHGAYVGFSGTYASQFAVTGIKRRDRRRARAQSRDLQGRSRSPAVR